MKNKRFVILGFSLLGILTLLFLSFHQVRSGLTITSAVLNPQETIYPYQCIDTMKVARDRAQDARVTDSVIKEHITKIKQLGANCVAIATPFDEAFLPYLTRWVKAARAAELSVWFRGNWASWEGWYDYPARQSTDEHIADTVQFIHSHPELFQDGDIFSPNTEPENGNPFAPIDSEYKHTLMVNYLTEEQKAVKAAFTAIGKDIRTSWVSLSGGVAKMIINETTLSALDRTVTIDHYVESPEGITEYIDYFHDTFAARIVFGEFGAPIPDINGPMTPKEQADFVNELFWKLYSHQEIIDGINYWTLTDSSTALIDEDGNEKPVAAVVKQHYIPGKISLSARDTSEAPIKDVSISMKKATLAFATDHTGSAAFLLPQGSYVIFIRHPEGETRIIPLTIRGGEHTHIEVRFSRDFFSFPFPGNFLHTFL